MPDRTILPRGFPRHYGGIFIQVCELQSPDSIASSAVLCLKKDIRKFGQSGNQLLARVAQQLQPLNQDSLQKRTTNWTDEYDNIDVLARGIEDDPLDVELALRACRQILHRLEDGEEIDDLTLALHKQRLINLWEARFEENIPLSGPYHAGTDYESVKEHLSHVRPYIEHEIEKLLNGENPPKIEDIFAGDIMLGIFI